MGCDIHTFVEVKIDGKWHLYNQPETNRNYALFEKMAGVRGELSNAIKPPAGLPKDVSEVTKLCREYFGSDGHSDSYLLQHEIAKLERWIKDQPSTDVFSFYNNFGFLFGNSINLTDAEDDIPIEDCRLVFWFDN